jgi:hypothetical protein
MKRNLLIKVLPNQMIKMEDCTEWSIDNLGLHVTVREETVRKEGEELKTTTTEKKHWFNSAGVLTVGEEYVR